MVTIHFLLISRRYSPISLNKLHNNFAQICTPSGKCTIELHRWANFLLNLSAKCEQHHVLYSIVSGWATPTNYHQEPRVPVWHFHLIIFSVADTLIARMTKQSIADVGGPWVEDEQRWGGPNEAHLKLSYRVTCAAHYYGAGCEVLCRPRDDGFGHYTCSAAGEIVCKSGWTGSYCTTRKYLPTISNSHTIASCGSRSRIISETA